MKNIKLNVSIPKNPIDFFELSYSQILLALTGNKHLFEAKKPHTFVLYYDKECNILAFEQFESCDFLDFFFSENDEETQTHTGQIIKYAAALDAKDVHVLFVHDFNSPSCSVARKVLNLQKKLNVLNIDLFCGIINNTEEDFADQLVPAAASVAHNQLMARLERIENNEGYEAAALRTFDAFIKRKLTGYNPDNARDELVQGASDIYIKHFKTIAPVKTEPYANWGNPYIIPQAIH